MEPRAFSYHPIYFVSFLKVRLEFLEVEQPIRACGLGLKKKNTQFEKLVTGYF